MKSYQNIDPMGNIVLLENLTEKNTNAVMSIVKEGRRVREVAILTPDCHTATALIVNAEKKDGTFVGKLRGLHMMMPVLPARQVQLKDHLPKEDTKGWVLSKVVEILRDPGDDTQKVVKDFLRKVSRRDGLYLTAMHYVGKTGVEHIRLYDFAEEARPYDKVNNPLFDNAVSELEVLLGEPVHQSATIRYKVLDE